MFGECRDVRYRYDTLHSLRPYMDMQFAKVTLHTLNEESYVLHTTFMMVALVTALIFAFLVTILFGAVLLKRFLRRQEKHGGAENSYL